MQHSQNYQIGDRVREISTGDEGIVVESSWYMVEGEVNIDWRTGNCSGGILHLNKDDIELVVPAK